MIISTFNIIIQAGKQSILQASWIQILFIILITLVVIKLLDYILKSIKFLGYGIIGIAILSFFALLAYSTSKNIDPIFNVLKWVGISIAGYYILIVIGIFTKKALSSLKNKKIKEAEEW